jgi:hypothetical protein
LPRQVERIVMRPTELGQKHLHPQTGSASLVELLYFETLPRAV